MKMKIRNYRFSSCSFLNRVELKGQEVPAFNAALEYLQQKAGPLIAAAEAEQQQAVPPETVTSALPLAGS